MGRQQVDIPYKKLLNRISDLVQVFDAAGRLIYVNQPWIDRLGYTADAITQMRFQDVMRESADWESIYRQLQADEAVIVEREMALINRAGESLLVEAHFSRQSDSDDEPTCFLGIFTDVTEQRRLEASMKDMHNDLAMFAGGRTTDLLAINRRLKNEVQERERIEEALRKSEENWRSLVENAPDYIMTVDRDHRIQFANRVGSGVRFEDMIGASVYDFVPSEQRNRMKAAFEHVFETGESTSYEIALVGPEGDYRWFSTRVSPLIRAGEVIGLTLISTDATEQRQTAEALRESEARFRAIIETTPVSIIITQIPSGRILFANEAAGDILGLPHEALIGMRGEEFYYNSTERHMLFDTLEREGGVRSYEFRIRRSDGTPVWIVTSMTPITFDGKPALLSTSYDITGRKMAEEELNRIFTLSIDMLGIAGFDGFFKRLNPSWEKILDYSVDELLGEPYLAFVHPDDRERARAEANRMVNGCPSVNLEIRFRCRNGSYRWLSWSAVPYMEERFYFVARDITERKQSEEKIQSQNRALLQANEELAIARQKAEEASRLKSQFLATMSHELRTPLNAIIGYTDILLAGMAGDLEEEQYDYQQRILKNAEHLLSLINDILDLAKIEAGRVEIIRKPFNLAEWVDEIRLQTHGLAEKKSLTFEVKHDQRLPDVLVGDPGRLKQIALNLLSNAIKFTESGVVKFSVRKHGKDTWTMIVQDTGIGIPPHMQETIFDEFRQVDGSSRRRHSGSGLGLAIVRKLALVMGGNVRVQSKVGEGSTFTVFLPIVEVGDEQWHVESYEYDAH